ncbi:hypothetical protein MCEMSEM18_03331 [Comamonadaceae bacterium]
MLQRNFFHKQVSLGALDPVSIFKIAGRAFALLTLSFAFFIAYTYSLPFFHSSSPSGDWMPLVWIVGTQSLQYLVLASALGAVFALPLALLWGRFAYLAALVCVAPSVVTMVTVWIQPGKFSLILIVGFSVVLLIVLVPFFAQVAHRWLERRAARSVQGIDLET